LHFEFELAGKYSNRLRKELVIFITPHVISN
jgi:type II secretory pathway component HofQ